MAQDDISRILTAIDELRKEFSLFKDSVNEKLANDLSEIKLMKQNCANIQALKKATADPEPWVKKTLPYMQFILLTAGIAGVVWAASQFVNKISALVK